MSGDLISRSRLLETLNYNKAIHEDENGETRQLIAIDINKMIEYVEKMPVAYDVDKVVEQLAGEIVCDGCSGYTNCFELNKRSECGTYKAIEKLVKAGGINERD